MNWNRITIWVYRKRPCVQTSTLLTGLFTLAVILALMLHPTRPVMAQSPQEVIRNTGLPARGQYAFDWPYAAWHQSCGAFQQWRQLVLDSVRALGYDAASGFGVWSGGTYFMVFPQAAPSLGALVPLLGALNAARVYQRYQAQQYAQWFAPRVN
jgi:hypothetical protein